ncbi:YNFM family putative membrane transporter [Cytobacillus kochii]|nr:YNFM family putative membrane transporter [Cytobacillus kochii]
MFNIKEYVRRTILKERREHELMNGIQQGTNLFKKVNIAFFAAGFNTFAILYCMQPLLPEFSKIFSITPAEASLSLSLTTVVLAISMLFFGSISEVWGRKPIMVYSMFISSFLCILTAFSPSFEILLIYRVLIGVTLAGLPSIAMAYLSEEMDPKSLGKAMGLYISGNATGAVFGRVFTGVITDYFSWQIAILGVGLIGFIATMYFQRSLPDSKFFKPRLLNLRSLSNSLIDHLKDPMLLGLFFIGFLLLGSNVALFNYVGYLLMSEPFSYSHATIGWLFLIYLIGVVSSTINAKLVRSYGKEKMLVSYFTLAIVGTVCTAIPHIIGILLGLSIFIFGFFGAHAIASSWVGQRATHDKAQASSLYLFLYYFGSSVGGTVAGFFWSRYEWHGVIGMVVIFLMIGFALVASLQYMQKNHVVLKQQWHSYK